MGGRVSSIHCKPHKINLFLLYCCLTVEQTRNLARYGRVDSGGTPKNWSSFEQTLILDFQLWTFVWYTIRGFCFTVCVSKGYSCLGGVTPKACKRELFGNAESVFLSDVNKDLGLKAKDTSHKVKAKAKALGYQGQCQGQGLGSQGQGQGLEMSKPITKTEGQSWQRSKIILTGTLLSDSFLKWDGNRNTNTVNKNK